MFSCSQMLRSTVKGVDTAKSPETRNDKNSSLQQLMGPFKKIETRHSMLSPTLKNSIISDCDYNSFIYEWRKHQIAPIVNVIELGRRSEIDPTTGLSRVHKTIKPEAYQFTLNSFYQFTKQQLMYIFKNLLEGHQAIFKKMKATSVSLEKCIVNTDGCVKVWVNQQLQRNDISGQILSKQQTVTKRIFQIICFLAMSNSQQKIQDFIQYVQSSVKKSGKWTFNYLKAMLKSYCDCLRMKIPKVIENKNRRHEKRSIQSSMITKEKPLIAQRPRQKSFQINYRNATSSLNCSRGFIQESKNFFGNHGLDCLVKNPTSKSINENDTSCTIKTLPTKTQHTSSISKFRVQEDPVLQNSVHRVERNSSASNSSVNEGRKLSSINDILLSKIGFCSLPEVHCEEEFSNCPSARKDQKLNEHDRRLSLTIASQFSLQIDKSAKQYVKPSKQSSISTTNQTTDSGFQFCFSRKTKGSHLTINTDENKENYQKNDDFKTASRDRFKDSNMAPHTEEKKNIIGSCTNWSSKRNFIGLSQYSKDLKISTFCTSVQKIQSSRVQKNQANQTINQIKNDIEISLKQLGFGQQVNTTTITPEKAEPEIIKKIIKNPITLLTQLRSVEEIQSYENTQKNSISADSRNHSVRKIKMPIEQKILQLLNINRNLVVSTYMETSSEKKIKQTDSPDKMRQRKLRDIEETLSELIHANLKQQQIIEGNKWTKRLENLLGIEEQMKESISFGTEEACALLREIKMSKLGKWGRAIGSSRVETEECQ